MQFSEAMRLGAMVGPQAHGTLSKTLRTGFLGLFGPTVEATCAIGAAYAAGNVTSTLRPMPVDVDFTTERGVRVKGRSEYVKLIPGEWYEFMHSEQWCPVCASIAEARVVIAHLNDTHRWTREQIADWVETIEQQAAAQPQDETAVLAQQG